MPMNYKVFAMRPKQPAHNTSISIRGLICSDTKGGKTNYANHHHGVCGRVVGDRVHAIARGTSRVCPRSRITAHT